MSGRLTRIQDWEKLAAEAKFHPAVMAAMCPVSLRQLERFFSEQFRQSPGKWSRELKCRLARELVAKGWSNKAIVSELGFGNESHLCHEFKRVYGVSPQRLAPLYGSGQKWRNVASRQERRA